MKFLRLALAAAALSVAAGQAPAATVGGYTSFLAFGDSLTDNGNLYAATGGLLPPSPPYFNGRISNGPVWADYVADRFTTAGLPDANFAFGFANAVPDGDGVPDLPGQLAIAGISFPASALGAKPLASLWFGANDLFVELDKATSDLGSVKAVAVAAANAVRNGALLLAAQGITDLIVFNLPDLGSIPRFALFDPAKSGLATQGTDEFNARLADNILILRALGINVTEIDVGSLFEALKADPTQFGLTNATDPCFVPLVSLCTPEEALEWAFFDQSHPNSVIHRTIGDIVLADIAPVPVPASVVMLGAGLAGLGLLRRRRAA